ncbi:MAG: serine/threonine protein kinase [Kofleriaceae bacterium]|nr:serine/threonine protein kinase [Kofleriaceae bacterium]MBP6848965.1 serine/threonine protein kinase [Kofleriaceae bacterium]
MTEFSLPPRPAPRRPLSAGDQIGAYTLTGVVIGSGGFGRVYEGVQPQLALRVAIKVQDSLGDPSLHERALLEAAALARIQHRHVVRVFDAGQLADGRHFLVMEHLSGETLDRVCKAGPVPTARALAILAGVASALDAIHARGIVHRDLKPSNVFLCRDDDGEVFPKLIDFGIAKDLAVPAADGVTRTGAFIGTPQYMSPEQCDGTRAVDARSDVYAFGLVAYHLLTGRPPFDGSTIDVAHAHLHAIVPSIRAARPELPAALDDAFAVVLAKEPNARPASATAALEVLQDALAGTAPAGFEPSPSRSTPVTPASSAAAAPSASPTAARTVREGAGAGAGRPAPAPPRARHRWLLAALAVTGAGALLVPRLLTRGGPDAPSIPDPVLATSSVDAAPLDAAPARVNVDAAATGAGVGVVVDAAVAPDARRRRRPPATGIDDVPDDPGK